MPPTDRCAVSSPDDPGRASGRAELSAFGSGPCSCSPRPCAWHRPSKLAWMLEDPRQLPVWHGQVAGSALTVRTAAPPNRRAYLPGTWASATSGDEMRYRGIGDGRVSLTVSDICLGIMNFGYRTDERSAFDIMDRFVDAGG